MYWIEYELLQIEAGDRFSSFTLFLRKVMLVVCAEAWFQMLQFEGVHMPNSPARGFVGGQICHVTKHFLKGEMYKIEESPVSNRESST